MTNDVRLTGQKSFIATVLVFLGTAPVLFGV